MPDNQTIASHLSDILAKGGTRYAVVNHGHTAFYSSQEAALFATLLRNGQRCDLAVFLDGLNDSRALEDVPLFTDRTATGFLKEERAAQSLNTKQVAISPAFPPVRVFNRLFGRRTKDSGGAGRVRLPNYDAVDTYRFNLTAIEKMAEAANIKVAAYWQPTPFDYMAGAEQRVKTNTPSWRIPRSNALVRQKIADRTFHFIADMFQLDNYEDIYVDTMHYGDRGNRRVAEVIAASLKSEGLLQGE